MASHKRLILVVDDDIRLLRMMRRILELENYRVLAVDNGSAALEVFSQDTPDLVLLDVMMPGMDGHTVCQRIRDFSSVPIIMVTARGDDSDKVYGLDGGADDYITKPFSASELTARVRAMLRRASLPAISSEPVFSCQSLIIDFSSQRVKLGEEDVSLTATEFRVLSYLAQNAGRVITPNQILATIWGEEYTDETNLVQANISRIRKKLGEDSRNPRYILTRPGIGYILPGKEQR